MGKWDEQQMARDKKLREHVAEVHQQMGIGSALPRKKAPPPDPDMSPKDKRWAFRAMGWKL